MTELPTDRNVHTTDANRIDSAWTTRQLLDWMTRSFESNSLDSPRLCAELLLSHVIGCERLRLYMNADRPATPLERESLRKLVSRALRHEPVQYLVGEAWFFSLPFHVDHRVLIPRPSSETIVEHVLQQIRAEPTLAPGGSMTIADVGTGSGSLAVALAKNLPGARVVATDISSEALEVAHDNACRHHVEDRIECASGDLLQPVIDQPGAVPVDILVANPPYIPDHEWAEVPANVKDYEPEEALRGGYDGLKVIQPLLDRVHAAVRPGGLILIEIASSTVDAVLELARSNPKLSGPRIEDDFEGLPRVLVAHRGE